MISILRTSSYSAISPQTVILSRLDSGRPETWPEENGWFAIDTWLGKIYIHPANYLYGELQEASSTILLETNTPIYDQPSDGPVLQHPIAALSPQAVEAAASAESDGYSGWQKVKTWLGDKWIMGGLPVERIEETITYSKPFTVFNKFRGETTKQLKPQIVKAVARAAAVYGSYWTYVQTDAGYRWLVATEPSDEKIVIDHNVVIYSGEFGDKLQEAGELGPQTVQAFEKVKGLDDWYHIHSSWKGDVWIWTHVEKQPTAK